MMHLVCFFGSLLLILGWGTKAQAAITFPWSSSFNCADWNSTMGVQPNCDQLGWTSGNTVLDGNVSSITSLANNTSGGGGKGARFYVKDGHNINSSSLSWNFLNGGTVGPQKELWIRWYQRYQKGFSWNPLHYEKTLYIRTGASSIDVIPGFYEGYTLVAQGSPNYYQVNTSFGWNNIMGGPVSDGLFHCFEAHIKMDTNGTDGIGRLWIDGVLRASNTAVNWSNGNAIAKQGWKWFDFHNNQNAPANASGLIGQATAYVDYDDMMIYNTTPPNKDAQGNPFIGPIGWNGTAPASAPAPAIPVTTLFEDKFEDANLSGRGWYDNTSPTLSSAHAVAGSTKSLEFRFPVGATKPTNGGAMRKKFTDSDSVYVSYYVTYSANWVGSNRNYHPHEFYLLTNKDGDWSGLANTRLTAYVEQNAGTPLVAIQDGLNIDQTKINQSLTAITEARGVAGCNGDSDGYGAGTCYLSGSSYVNGKNWKANQVYFSNTPGAYYKNDWHKVEVFFKLNSIANGKALADGVVQYWFDGQLIIYHKNVMFRTAQHPDMKFNQFIIAPWIGDGSPVDQTFWVDNLTVASGPTGTATMPKPPAPRALRVAAEQ